ncbi:phage terminase large subunit [Ruegeria sp. 2205SS24-7]|uniref:PBSX family phage terminase large subunit n=1 Tax=Ruegeria discodermiae TaxID=3064389 RepID=UPI0027424FFF|nr:phage terminase large subunit [Ruegeria sp. 2205SS24-7]MDP5216703.1 phage terminase large subunit [Ruegeria sp. 2205SS24-7]
MTQSGTTIEAKVARWALPLLKPSRYKIARGGRSGGKSHQFCEIAAEKMASNPTFKVAGIREVQKSIKHSMKSLLEQKIHEQGASYLFDMQSTEIKRHNGDTAAAFFGMQDHTADAVKGLEDFDLGLVDEANNLSATSIKKLTPTLRKEGSEIWFAYNPDQETDPIDVFIAENEGHEDFLVLSVNIFDNPFVSDTAWKEYRREKARAVEARERIAAARAIKEDPADADLAIVDKFNHVWLGYYDNRSQRLVFHNWKEGELDVPDNVVWFYGIDWGFASDPMAANRFCFPSKSTMYISHEAHGTGIRNEDVPGKLLELPGIADRVSRADSARPEMVDYCRRNGLPKIRSAKKGKGSVEDGYSFLQGLDIVVHPRCKNTLNEFKVHSYKIVKHTGEILTTPEDKDNHHIDGLRYGAEGAHRKGKLLEGVVEEQNNRLERPQDAYSSVREDADSWKVA